MPMTCKETVAEYFAAIRSMDADRFASLFAPNGSTHDPVGAPPYTGHEAIRGFFNGICSVCSSIDLTEQDVFVCGNSAAVRWNGKGTTKAGKDFTFAGVDVIDCNAEGRIDLVRAFWDPAPLQQALGA